MGKVVRAIRLHVARPQSCDWKTFGKTMRDMRYHTSRILNFCMTERFLYERRRNDFKDEFGKYPTIKELPGIDKDLYRKSRDMAPEMSARMVSEIVNKSKLKWNADRKDCYYRMDKSLSSFKRSTPLFLSNQSFKIKKDKGVYSVAFTVGSKKADIGRMSVILDTSKIGKSQKDIIDRVMSGAYKAGTAQLKDSRGKGGLPKWFIMLPYTNVSDPDAFALDHDKTLGIDLGIVYAFYAAASDSPKTLYGGGAVIAEFRKRIRYRKRSFLVDGKFSGRGGRGRNHMMRPSLNVGDRERKFRDTKYHQYTKQIIEFCLSNQIGVIQIENLDGLKRAKVGRPVLDGWAIGDFQQKLKYKAEPYGIDVVEVHPQYTSQRCSKCGHISKDNRPTQESFKCVSCGYKDNADRNAARNLSVRGIDDIISRTLSARENDSQLSIFRDVA